MSAPNVMQTVRIDPSVRACLWVVVKICTRQRRAVSRSLHRLYNAHARKQFDCVLGRSAVTSVFRALSSSPPCVHSSVQKGQDSVRHHRGSRQLSSAQHKRGTGSLPAHRSSMQHTRMHLFTSCLSLTPFNLLTVCPGTHAGAILEDLVAVLRNYIGVLLKMAE